MSVILLMPRFRSSPPLLMSKDLAEKSTSGPNSPPLDSTVAQTSILVLLSARAIGSLGFAVSLFAIWFGWLLPASFTASDTSEIKKPRPSPKHRRRSASSRAATPVRRRPAPVDLAPILVPHSEENSSRRVSFADSPSTPVARRNTLPEPGRPSNSSATSFSTTPTPSPATSLNGSHDDLNTRNFDSSPSCHSRLQKLKLGFNLKKLPVDKQSDRDSINSIESTVSENIANRSNTGFVAAWSNSRARTAGDGSGQGFASPSRLSFARLLSPSTPTTATMFTPSSFGPHDIQSPTFSSGKGGRRRSSTPIPRTYPYGAPYFASPPVLLDKNHYPTYLKTLPQFEDEVQLSSERLSGMGRAQVTGKDRRRAIFKRRSASEDWTVRPLTNM